LKRSRHSPGFVITPATALHLLIEAKKVAYADMARYVADPRFPPFLLWRC
jgi:gamma-glutamyltranspeptidase